MFSFSTKFFSFDAGFRYHVRKRSLKIHGLGQGLVYREFIAIMMPELPNQEKNCSCLVLNLLAYHLKENMITKGRSNKIQDLCF